jgi:phycocyanobilin lyase beta subunit
MTQSVEVLIAAVEQADSAGKLCQAVATLAQARHEAAIPTLIAVLGYNNPGASVCAVDGLIVIGESVVPYLLENLDGYNYGARAWAIRVFAGIGDPRALDLLLEAAESDFALSVRRAAAKGLGTIRWEKIPLKDRQSQQQTVFETLVKVTGDSEWVVRYAAIVALQSLAQQETRFRVAVGDRLAQLLQTDEELAVRARAKKAHSELLEAVSL